MKIKLPFRLGHRRQKRVKVAEGQLSLFVQQDFDSRALLVGVYDFAKGYKCGNGHISTSYVCRIDESVGGRIDPAISANLSTYAEGLKKLNPGTDPAELVPQIQALAAEKEKVLEQLKNGKLPFEDFEDFVINGNLDVDASNANFVIRGMEPGFSQGKNATQEELLSFLAEDIAISKLTNSGVITDGKAVGLIHSLEGQNVAWSKAALTDELGTMGNRSRFSKQYQSLIESQDPLSRKFNTDIATYMSNASATVDQLIVRGTTTGDTRMYDILRSQSDPRFGRAPISRDAFTVTYGPKRDQAFLQALSKNAQTNPEFRGGMATPGSDKKGKGVEKWNAYLRLAEQHRANGGKVFSTTYSAKNSKMDGVQSNSSKVNDVETLAFEFDGGKNGKKYFVASRLSANSTGVRPNTMKDIFTSTESAARSGKLPEWSGKAPALPQPRRNSAAGSASSSRPRRAKPAAEPESKKPVGMSNWSASRLEKARERLDPENPADAAKIAQINAILANK